MKIVTAFTVAHSITLSLAALGLVDVPSSIVEPLIAASIVWVAVENLVAPAGAGRRWLIAGVFGLIHGLGFASALVELDLAARRLVRALVGFNIGVELGQLAFVAVVMPPLVWASRPGRLPRLPQILSVIVALVGVPVWSGRAPSRCVKRAPGVGRRWLVAGAFGLVHGLGFASALIELDLSRDALLRALVGFNVGVELGQLAFVAVFLPPFIWASRADRLPRLPQLLSVLVALVGAVWLLQRLFGL